MPSEVPTVAWALTWSFFLGQVLTLADRGLSGTDGIWVVVSIAIGGVLVGWTAAGVLTARTGRLVLAWVVLALSVLGNCLALIDPTAGEGAGWSAVHLTASLTQVALLAWFCSTGYFAWQRTRPATGAPALGSLIAIAAVVGMLGGVTDVAHQDATLQIRVGG